MRKKEREVVGADALAEILDRCQTLRIAFNAEYPYIVPVSFGYRLDNDKFTLYFHSAMAGRKVELIAANTPCKVGFEADRVDGVGSKDGSADTPCTWTCWYESVIGEGIVSLVEGDEKREGLDALMKHYRYEGKLEYDPRGFALANVYKIEVSSITGKRR